MLKYFHLPLKSVRHYFLPALFCVISYLRIPGVQGYYLSPEADDGGLGFTGFFSPVKKMYFQIGH